MKTKSCTITDCQREFYAREVCKLHYYRFKNSGRYDILKKLPVGKTECCIPYCQNVAVGHELELCRSHYRLQYRMANKELWREQVTRYNSAPKTRMARMRATAKKRNFACDIPEQDYIELLQDPCYYCGGPLEKTGAGLDRIDSSIGYTLSNVVPCCLQCNQAKMDYTQEEFIEHARKIVARFNDGSN